VPQGNSLDPNPVAPWHLTMSQPLNTVDLIRVLQAISPVLAQHDPVFGGASPLPSPTPKKLPGELSAPDPSTLPTDQRLPLGRQPGCLGL
jgi:hypothetical protein